MGKMEIMLPLEEYVALREKESARVAPRAVEDVSRETEASPWLPVPIESLKRRPEG